MSAAQKRSALAAIETGAAQVVVGTHALIQQGVTFHRLGAVVADEQHRFGVAQRAALSAKGENAARAGHVGHSHPAHARAHPVRRPGCVRAGRGAARPQPGQGPMRWAKACESASPRSSTSRSKPADRSMWCVRSSRRAKPTSKAREQHAKDLQGRPAPPPHRRAARPHEKRGQGAGDARFCRRAVRYPGCDDRDRGRRRHAERQPDGGRGTQTGSACPSCTSCAAAWAAARGSLTACFSARTRGRPRASGLRSCAGPATGSRSRARDPRAARPRATFSAAGSTALPRAARRPTSHPTLALMQHRARGSRGDFAARPRAGRLPGTARARAAHVRGAGRRGVQLKQSREAKASLFASAPENTARSARFRCPPGTNAAFSAGFRPRSPQIPAELTLPVRCTIIKKSRKEP